MNLKNMAQFLHKDSKSNMKFRAIAKAILIAQGFFHANAYSVEQSWGGGADDKVCYVTIEAACESHMPFVVGAAYWFISNFQRIDGEIPWFYGECNYRTATGGYAWFSAQHTYPGCNAKTTVGTSGFAAPSSDIKESGNTCPRTTQPIAMGSGNKYLAALDLSVEELSFKRSFNVINARVTSSALITRAPATVPILGTGWTFEYQQQIRIADATASITWSVRPSGRIYTYTYATSSGWTSDKDVADTLAEIKDNNNVRTGWRYYVADSEQTETYDANGILQSIAFKDGTVQTLVYSDGSDGVASGQGGFVLDASGSPTASLLPAGLLLRVTDTFGHGLSFGYDALSHITRLADSAGNVVRYAYDAAGDLASVMYPDASTKTYLYGESAYISGASLPHALTGILDENNLRYASYWYDTNGRAYDEKIAEGSLSGVNRSQLAYHLDGSGNVLSTDVTDALGATRIYGFTSLLGVNRLTGVSQPGGSGCGATSSAITYDVNGNAASRTDFNGNKQCVAFDLSRNLETVRLEGLPATTSCPADLSAYTIPAPVPGASVTQTKMSTQWHPAWRLESRRAEAKLITTSVYNGQVDPTNVSAGPLFCAPASATITDATGATIPIAMLCRKIEQATSDETGTRGFGAMPVGSPRIWNYTYNQVGQILSEDGPRTDVNDITTYAYYPDTSFDAAGVGHTMGDLWKVTNALGQVTETTQYDKAGHVLQVRDANGTLTQNTYTPRGWLKTQSTVLGGAVGSQTLTTIYDYDGVGQLTKVTQPDGSSTTYTYDAAHRLTDISDSLNNTIHYVLDAAGNRTAEQVKDPSGTLKRTTARIFDQLGRLQNVVVQ